MAAWEIYNADCLVKMQDIPDKSIDAIICDLPYTTTSCDWDKLIPFDALWTQYRRIIKDRSAIVLFGQEPFSSKLRLSNEFWYRYDWIWKKNRSTNFLNAKNCPLKTHELISVFSSGSINHETISGRKSNRMNYYPVGVLDCDINSQNNIRKFTGTVIKDNAYGKSEYKQTKQNYPKSILEFNSDNLIKSLHPTQKPVKLLEYLIKTYTQENQVVLDNCAGSGSTGVACLNTNRHFIGIEKDEKFFQVAKNRLETHQKELDTSMEQFFTDNK